MRESGRSHNQRRDHDRQRRPTPLHGQDNRFMPPFLPWGDLDRGEPAPTRRSPIRLRDGQARRRAATMPGGEHRRACARRRQRHGTWRRQRPTARPRRPRDAQITRQRVPDREHGAGQHHHDERDRQLKGQPDEEHGLEHHPPRIAFSSITRSMSSWTAKPNGGRSPTCRAGTRAGAARRNPSWTATASMTVIAHAIGSVLRAGRRDDRAAQQACRPANAPQASPPSRAAPTATTRGGVVPSVAMMALGEARWRPATARSVETSQRFLTR